jgi:hypothetical protein
MTQNKVTEVDHQVEVIKITGVKTLETLVIIVKLRG